MNCLHRIQHLVLHTDSEQRPEILAHCGKQLHMEKMKNLARKNVEIFAFENSQIYKMKAA